MKKILIFIISVVPFCFVVAFSDLSYHELETKGVALFLERKYDKANLFFNEMLKDKT